MKVAIYGAGNYGQYVLNEIRNNVHTEISVVCWIDNFVERKAMSDLPVYTEELFFQLKQNDNVDAVIVAVRNYEKNLISQKIIVSLLLKGYNQIYVALPEFFRSQVPVLDEMGKFSPFVKFYKDIMPTERMMLGLVLNKCNLNCKRCEHGSNLVHEDDFLDLDEFEGYLIHLKRKFKNILEFQLLGGEPLLNPQLDQYIVLTQRYFPATQIVIVSNGLLIPRMSSKLIDVIINNNVKFFITQYPPTKDRLEQIMDVLDRNRIAWDLTSPRIQFRRWVTLKEKDGEKAFRRWKESDCICHVIDKGRIYICPCIPKLYDMKEYLNIDISEKELIDSSIDLMSDAVDGWDILCYYEHATPLCRFCCPEEVLEKWEVGVPDKADYFAD